MKEEVKKQKTNNKPSALDQFQLFYEAVPAPDYIEEASKDPVKPSSFRDRRISRNRK